MANQVAWGQRGPTAEGGAVFGMGTQGGDCPGSGGGWIVMILEERGVFRGRKQNGEGPGIATQPESTGFHVGFLAGPTFEERVVPFLFQKPLQLLALTQ